MSSLTEARRRHRNLSEASEKYMRGEIDLEKYEESERQNMTDYRAVVRALSQARNPFVSWTKLLRTGGTDQNLVKRLSRQFAKK